MRLVILRLIREKPMHGYEIIKALEEQFHGCYTPSAGSVYPTLQMLEDQGYVRIVEEGGKKIYHITPEGEAFLDNKKTCCPRSANGSAMRCTASRAATSAR
jgi:DNA-binding PadR family transcriptional regulator